MQVGGHHRYYCKRREERAAVLPHDFCFGFRASCFGLIVALKLFLRQNTRFGVFGEAHQAVVTPLVLSLADVSLLL